MPSDRVVRRVLACGVTAPLMWDQLQPCQSLMWGSASALQIAALQQA
jgi:hypothetical protein